MDKDKLIYLCQEYNSGSFNHYNDDMSKLFYDILLNNGIIKIRQDGSIKKLNKSNVSFGTLSVNNKFGFVTSPIVDIYVFSTRNYIDQDLVLVLEGEFRGKKEGKILGLLERTTTNLVLFVSNNLEIEPINERAYSNYKFLYDRNKIKNYKDSFVEVSIVDIRNTVIKIKFLEKVANSDDPDLKMKLILSEFDIETEFSNQALEDTQNSINQSINIDNRVDLRNNILFTIDGNDAKDLDDAVGLIKEGNNYRLFVSIADVSSYVIQGTTLDKEAFDRASSVYFVDRVVPMLPEEISNGVCSLNQGIDKLTLTCEMLINPEGDVIESSIYESVINSKYRLTYDDVNACILDNDTVLIDKYKDIFGILKEMHKLSLILKKKRENRGSFTLEDKEPVFILDENKDIKDIIVRQRRDAEKLIEEFMICANETVAQTFSQNNISAIYRVHEKPIIDKLKELQEIMPFFGITDFKNLDNFNSKTFKQVLDQATDINQKRLLSGFLVRSLQRAIYSDNNIGHFGLASEYYTHFTSPIRRYPDLVVHRLLKEYIIKYNKVTKDNDSSIKYICDYVSQKEHKIFKAEMKIEDQMKALYMRQFVGQVFKGTVVSFRDFGIFVELENTQRGLIRFDSLQDFIKLDKYEVKLRDDKFIKLGQDINVMIVGVDINRGLVDFVSKDHKMCEVNNEDNSKEQKSKVRLSDNKNNRSRNRVKGKRNKVYKRR
ncbi:MAG: ribonuclease R family protein [Mycoplasmatales bacterium]